MNEACTVTFDGGYIYLAQPDQMYHLMGDLLHDQENHPNQHHNNQKICDKKGRPLPFTEQTKKTKTI